MVVFISFATTFMAEQRVSLHQSKYAPYSGATQGTMPSPPVFYDFFKKIPTTMSRSIARANGFLMETRSCEK
jgi:hypothetical protein